MNTILKKNRGLTLIELLVALVISGLLVAGLYRTFIGQQKTYTVQESGRRYAAKCESRYQSDDDRNQDGGFWKCFDGIAGHLYHGYFQQCVESEYTHRWVPSPLSLSVGGTATLTIAGGVGQTQIVVSTLTDDKGNALFDTGEQKICLRRWTGKPYHHFDRQWNKNPHFEWIHLLSLIPLELPVFTVRALSYQVAISQWNLHFVAR